MPKCLCVVFDITITLKVVIKMSDRPPKTKKKAKRSKSAKCTACIRADISLESFRSTTTQKTQVKILLNTTKEHTCKKELSKQELGYLED